MYFFALGSCHPAMAYRCSWGEICFVSSTVIEARRKGGVPWERGSQFVTLMVFFLFGTCRFCPMIQKRLQFSYIGSCFDWKGFKFQASNCWCPPKNDSKTLAKRVGLSNFTTWFTTIFHDSSNISLGLLDFLQYEVACYSASSASASTMASSAMAPEARFTLGEDDDKDWVGSIQLDG